MAFDPRDIEEIKSRLTISSVIASHMQLVKKGAGEWVQKGNESFTVNDKKGFFYCFGCHEKGDVVGFVMKTEGLKQALDKYGFDAAFGGARRDEEKARAKERIFSFRDDFGQWNPKAQRPELWDLYNTRVHPGENMRVFPISNWTELDVWQYIAREQLALPNIYFAHQRQVIPRNGLLVPLTDLTPAKEGETVEKRIVRFRTVGDISCTCPVSSDASTVEAIIAETAVTQITERGATRMDDQTSEASMEKRKKEGYF